MKKILATLAHPMLYVLLFALAGAACVVCGVIMLVGVGWGLVAAGGFLLVASAYITRGITSG